MGIFRRIGRYSRSAWTLWRHGGDRAVVDHTVAHLRTRLGVDEIAQVASRLQSVELAVSTWAVTSWIERAVLDETPLVSVILPTRNRSRLLRRAVESLRSQVYPSWEVVIVDDGSTDDTPAVVDRLCRELDEGRVQSLRVPQGGCCAARNRGLAAAKGSLIAYLDDDNLMHPLWLKAVAWAFSQRPDVDVMYGAIVIDDILRVLRQKAGALPSLHLHPFEREGLHRYNLADIGAIAHRSGLPEARFDETLVELGDWDLLLRLTREKDPAVLPVVACFYSTAAPDRLSGGPSFEADAARVRAKIR